MYFYTVNGKVRRVLSKEEKEQGLNVHTEYDFTDTVDYNAPKDPLYNQKLKVSKDTYSEIDKDSKKAQSSEDYANLIKRVNILLSASDLSNKDKAQLNTILEGLRLNYQSMLWDERKYGE